MPIWLAITLAVCASAITVISLLVQIGRRYGSDRGSLDALEMEVARLREWRHKIGDDPSDSVGQLYDMLEKRVENLERKVWNGYPPRG